MPRLLTTPTDEQSLPASTPLQDRGGTRDGANQPLLPTQERPNCSAPSAEKDGEGRAVTASGVGGIRNSVALAKMHLFCDIISMGAGDAYHCTLVPPDRMQTLQIAKIVGKGATDEANEWYDSLLPQERDRFRDLDGRLCVMSYWLLQQHGFDFESNPLGMRRHDDSKKLCYISTDAERCLQHFLDTKGDHNVAVLYLIRLASAGVRASGGRHVSLHSDVAGQNQCASFGAARVAIPVSDVYKLDRTFRLPACTHVVKDGEPTEDEDRSRPTRYYPGYGYL